MRRFVLVALGLPALLMAGCSSGATTAAKSVHGNKVTCAAVTAWTTWDQGIRSTPSPTKVLSENQRLRRQLEANGPTAQSALLASLARATANAIAAGNNPDFANQMNGISEICTQLGYPVIKQG